jgi:hypothetical protein
MQASGFPELFCCTGVPAARSRCSAWVGGYEVPAGSEACWLFPDFGKILSLFLSVKSTWGNRGRNQGGQDKINMGVCVSLLHRCPMFQLSAHGNYAISHEGTSAGVVQLIALYLDPIYYMFEGCACEQGYNLQRVQGIRVGGPVPVFACIAIGHPWFSQNLWILAVIVGAGILMITWLVWRYCFRYFSGHIW